MYNTRLEEKTGSAAKRWKDGDKKKMFGGAGAAAAGIRSFVLCAVLVLAAGIVSNCSGGSDGGSGPPAPIPINTASGWSDSPSISRDGQRLYFMYSRYDFGPWIISGTPPVLSGPDRPGLHHSANPWDESDIYMAVRNPDGTWSEAVNLGLNGASGDSSGMEIDGGNTFIWLHGSGAGNDIVMASKAPDGTWNIPVNPGPGINDHTAGVFQDNPHLSPDGKGLWFTSNRAGGVDKRDIWFSLYTGSWSTPVNMGSPFNTTGEEDQIWSAPTGTTPEIYWNASEGLKRCTWNGSTCAEASPEIVTIPGCSYAAEVSMTDDGQYLYFGCGDPATGRVKIMYSVKQPGGSWGQATPVD